MPWSFAAEQAGNKKPMRTWVLKMCFRYNNYAPSMIPSVLPKGSCTIATSMVPPTFVLG